jgi:hypothetical protein
MPEDRREEGRRVTVGDHHHARKESDMFTNDPLMRAIGVHAIRRSNPSHRGNERRRPSRAGRATAPDAAR